MGYGIATWITVLNHYINSFRYENGLGKAPDRGQIVLIKIGIVGGMARGPAEIFPEL
jgi:hypothetical protein